MYTTRVISLKRNLKNEQPPLLIHLFKMLLYLEFILFIELKRVVVKPLFKSFSNLFGASGYQFGAIDNINRTHRLQIQGVLLQKREFEASKMGLGFNYNKFGVITNLLQYNRERIQ